MTEESEPTALPAPTAATTAALAMPKPAPTGATGATKRAPNPKAKPASKPAAKPASKAGAKTASKPAAKPASKPAAKPASKPAAKPAAKAVSKAAQKSARKPAGRQATKQAEVVTAVKETKPKKAKLVRDGFTMPKPEYALIAAIKKRCLAKGVAAKKSEVLRAAVIAFAAQTDAAVLATVRSLDVLKTGRPPGRK